MNPKRPSPPGDERTDDVVIDLRDNAADVRDQMIDLRDSVIDRTRVISTLVPDLAMSGRPAALQHDHRLVIDASGDEREAAEQFLYDQYRRIGFCDESPRQRVEELAPWAESSNLHMVIDAADEVVGTIRTIMGNYDELPVGKFERTNHEHPDPVCELSSLVVRPSDRGTGVIEHLYRAGWMDAFRMRASAVVALIDPWLFDAFRDHYGLPFRIVGTPRHYMGTDPVPVAMPLAGHEYDDLARTNPAFWLWTLEAITPQEVGAWGLPIILVDQVAEAEERVRSL